MSSGLFSLPASERLSVSMMISTRTASPSAVRMSSTNAPVRLRPSSKFRLFGSFLVEPVQKIVAHRAASLSLVRSLGRQPAAGASRISLPMPVRLGGERP